MFIKRDSVAVNLLCLDTEKAQALVQFSKYAQVYLYTDVSQDAIRSLVEDPQVSLGVWVLQHLVNLTKKVAPQNVINEFIVSAND